MGNEKRNSRAILVFTRLMKSTVNPGFSFPGGGLAIKTVDSCLNALETSNQGELSHERLVDYCVCQVYAIDGFGEGYLNRWKVNHSFGKKAIDRYKADHSRKKYYEDKWLSGYGLTRGGLADLIRERKDHPLSGFIYPEYEEPTKKRLHNTEAGFIVCQLSTLLYTPFSPTCTSCKFGRVCHDLTRLKYQELLRIRIEEYQRQ